MRLLTVSGRTPGCAHNGTAAGDSEAVDGAPAGRKVAGLLIFRLLVPGRLGVPGPQHAGEVLAVAPNWGFGVRVV